MWKVVVPVSGGKDSQACLKLAVEAHGADNVLGLFCDTGFEHPLTYSHIPKIAALYGVRIDTIRGKGDVPAKVRKYKRFPTAMSRFCTDELKMRPSRDAYAFIGDLWQQPFEVWYGMRSEESPARGKRYAGREGDEVYPPHEVFPKKYPKYLSAKMGIVFRLPVLDWTADDIKDFVGPENLNPLYQWFDRVGCFPCLAAGKDHKAKAFEHDDFGRKQYRIVQILEQETGKSVWSQDGSPGCAVCAM